GQFALFRGETESVCVCVCMYDKRTKSKTRTIYIAKQFSPLPTHASHLREPWKREMMLMATTVVPPVSSIGLLIDLIDNDTNTLLKHIVVNRKCITISKILDIFD
mgnify:CR=1